MVAKVKTVAFEGINTIKVETQAHFSSGVAGITIVGLGDKAVAESKERIRAAFSCIGVALPHKKITVNLSPADLLKEGSHYDLPIAVAILVEAGILAQSEVAEYYFMGEMSLDATLNHVNGVLPAAIEAQAELSGLVCPMVNGNEAAWSGNSKILAPNRLDELINHFASKQLLSNVSPSIEDSQPNYPDLRDIKGQGAAKRALEIAAAGGHNLLMVGPPGSGKSMLAKRMPGILPPMRPQEMLEVSIINSIAGGLRDGRISRERPFRDPHSSSSMPAIIGGGKNAKPGEISLAHNGVLFLDELPEYNRNVLESLRQPIENGNVTIARVNSHVTYPARFQLIAAMNPCKCGYFGDPKNGCNKMFKCAEEYQSRISGPLLDRFDIRIEVPAIGVLELDKIGESSESSACVRERVIKAREIQFNRYDGYNVSLNSQADGELLSDFTYLDDDSQKLLHQAVEKMGLSMRGYHRVLRVARTIADLAGANHINKFHLAEALSFRTVKTL